MQKLFEIFKVFKVQKKIVSADTIRGNTVCIMSEIILHHFCKIISCDTFAFIHCLEKNKVTTKGLGRNRYFTFPNLSIKNI